MQFLVTLNVYNRFFFHFILTENHISAQVKIHQQATESQCCDLFTVHRTNDHNTVGEDGFILLHHLKMVHFKQLHLLLSSTHIFFFGARQMIRSLICLLCSHRAGQLTERSLGAAGISNSSLPSAFPYRR